MGRRPIDSDVSRWAFVTLLVMGLISCSVAYFVVLNVLKPKSNGTPVSDSVYLASEKRGEVHLERENGNCSDGCCRGIPNFELYGSVAKWGADNKLGSAKECCESCKAMCSGNDGQCLCDTWVFCGDKKACGSQFGECWLKKQKDTLAPERHDAGRHVMWTSGLIFGKGEGIIGLETEHGTLHIKLYADCAPHSVDYILELLALRHCAGCQIYRAEGRGKSWDVKGNHIPNAAFGPPFAMIQGTLEAAGMSFKKIPVESCPTIRRGSVAWVGSGPEFFISLANHGEWKKSYTVFGTVLPEDMKIAEKITQLPTKPDVWNHINVSVLEEPIPIMVRRIKTNQEDLTHTI